MFVFRRQPFKTLYVLYFGVTLLFVRLPYWTIISLLPAWRPRRNWTLSRTIIVYGLQSLVAFTYTTGTFNLEDIDKDEKSADKLKFVWVDPLPQHLIQGEIATIANKNNVSPARIHGYWFGTVGEDGKHGQKAAKDERVLYHFHGGGYVMGTSSPSSAVGAMLNRMLELSPGVLNRAFGLGYRVSSAAPFPAANPFPAALIDAVAGYRYLVETLGFSPENIIVSGDSAGGHLAVAFIRYLNQQKIPSLPVPRAAILLSPTADWACTHDDHPSSSMNANANSDFVYTVLKNGYTATAIRGSFPHEELSTNLWLSPSSLKVTNTRGQFAGFPPTCIIAGDAEVTLDPMKTLRDRLVADNDPNDIAYWEYPDSAHDFLVTPFHEPERTHALKELATWMKALF
ncbi:alpha/beta-hydrolase [Gyrodon lividus]|nr:alpha/beta-hydrolase [Gyrodon lividus]